MGINSSNEKKPEEKNKEEKSKKRPSKEVNPKEEIESNFKSLKFKFKFN